jgi:predicted  nucleic acid-binding Zn-ribbon protein
MKDGVEQTTGAVNDYIDAMSTQMEIEAMQSTYQDLYNQKAEAQKTLTEETQKLNDAQSKLANSSNLSNEELTTLNQTVESQKEKVEQAQQAYDELNGSLGKQSSKLHC